MVRYLSCDAQSVENVDKCVAHMLTCVTSWNTMKPNEIGAQCQFMLNSFRSLLRGRLDPMGSYSHEWA